MEGAPESEQPGWAERLAKAAEVLEALDADRSLLAAVPEALRQRLLRAAGRAARPSEDGRRSLAKARRRHEREARRASDDAVLDARGIRLGRAAPVFRTPLATPPRLPAPGDDDAPPDERLIEAKVCYVCKTAFDRPHAFYDQLCRSCGDVNFAKRSQTADLRGRTALVSGARVKIGYQAAVMLLRAGARVIVLTRFPADAAALFASEPEAGAWHERLRIHGIDLRHAPSVEALAADLARTEPRLDFLLNNACQTVRRPAGFYRHLLDAESVAAAGAVHPLAAGWLADHRRLQAEHGAGGRLAMRDERGVLATGAALRLVDQGTGVLDSARLSQLALLEEDRLADPAAFPAGRLDADLQQLDLRPVNSWRLRLDEVSAVELLEVQLVNAVAPFILNARLRPLMARSGARDLHIVNVSAVEGQFYRRFKTDKHPHTNMAKAALNMMTRTSAVDYVKDGIHMNSVDTGWVTDEDPAAIAERKRSEHRFHPPLDVVDGAARVCDPIFDGLNSGRHVWGHFLKDYRPTDW